MAAVTGDDVGQAAARADHEVQGDAGVLGHEPRAEALRNLRQVLALRPRQGRDRRRHRRQDFELVVLRGIRGEPPPGVGGAKLELFPIG